MAELIPFNAQKAEDLNTRFSATPFRSTEDFINFYNSGLINKAADAVASFATEVDSAFKNVKLQSKTLVFISKEEVELEESLAELKKWDVLVKVKGRLEDLVKDQTINDDSTVAFVDDATGVLHAVNEIDGNYSYERLLDEKFFRPSDEWLKGKLHSEYSSLDATPGHFHVSDFTELEVTFVSQIHKILFTD